MLHGGYCKEYSGKQVKGLSLDDTWFLKMDGDDLSKIKWERRRKIGYAPSGKEGDVQPSMKHMYNLTYLSSFLHD